MEAVLSLTALTSLTMNIIMLLAIVNWLLLNHMHRMVCCTIVCESLIPKINRLSRHCW